ncbi:MAG: histidine phosphatase family protein [Nanoarchaeota archaeon]
MITIYIVRHGKTSFNAEKRLQGQLNSPLLNDGIKDATTLGETLQGINFDAIYASDLKRTKQTTQIIAKTARIKSRIQYKRSLREINYGKAAGLLKKQAKQIYPLYKKSVMFRFPKGESYADVGRRVIEFVKSLEVKKPRTVLIVTHAGCIREILHYFLKQPKNNYLQIPVSHNFIAKLVINHNKLVEHQILHS